MLGTVRKRPRGRKMKTRWLIPLLLLLGISVWAQSSGAVNPLDDINAGNRYLAAQDYQRAVSSFQRVLLDSTAQAFHGKAILGLGKVFLATGNLSEASSFLDNYVENYLDDSEYEDGLYQQARLYIFKGEYENALIALNGFLNSYPQTRYASNALFWAGESAFRLGYLDEATTLFNRVIQGYPRSTKIEAIQYRLSLIDLQRREEDLIKLLRWSHEENMFNLTSSSDEKIPTKKPWPHTRKSSRPTNQPPVRGEAPLILRQSPS
jgi:tetratricopeptide (TPR) repeat protein